MRLQAQRLKGSLTPTRLYLVRHGQVADGHIQRFLVRKYNLATG